jgi:hypothetical protein
MNRIAVLAVSTWVAIAAPSFAADRKPAKPVLIDLSSAALIDGAGARAVLVAAIPSSVWKLYPPAKWGFVSQVEGGFTPDRICVVTARVMLAPLTVTNGVILRPVKRATAFDAKPNATQEECRAIARDKLKEAADGVVSSLVRS